LHDQFEVLKEKHPVLKNTNNINQLGTLGTGNHFIEVCLDEHNDVWIMLHSGSRGVGNRIGSHFIELAKKDMEKWMIQLPDRDLAYLPEGTDHFNDYVEAVEWAQSFARINRQVMMQRVIKAMQTELELPFDANVEAVNCHHNYVSREHHYGKDVLLTRKGAVRARKGEMGIIPGSMGARSYIVRGLGNEESFCSCSHGAGRVMSRTEAKRRVSMEQHAKAVEGVECRKDKAVIDETPSAYKSIDAVMEAQKDLVEIVYTLKQVVCVKG
jgi:tRNA-splicing ligase RtcB